MTYGDFKDLTRKTASDKILCDRAFTIAKNPKYDGYLRGLASIVYKLFDKKSASHADKSPPGGAVKNENMSNQYLSDLVRLANVPDRTRELTEKLHKPIIRKFRKRKL